MMRMSRKWVPSVLVVVAIAMTAPIASAEVVDQVVATVDTEAILLSDIMAEIGPQINDIRRESPNEEAFNKAVQQKVHDTLNQAIENRILVREAQLAGLSVDDDTIEKRLEEYRKLFDTNEAFLKELEKEGETISDLRTRLRKQILARTMAIRKMRELEDGVVVSESEVAQYYEDHKDDFRHPERVRCSQIFIAAPANSDKRAVAKARVEQLRDEVISGTPFDELAIDYSEAPGAKDGGIIGWIQRGDLVKPLEDAAFSLEPGKVSDVIETDSGYHLIMVDKKEPAGLASLDEARKKIGPLLRTQVATERYQKWMDELRKRSRVRVFI